MGLLNCASFAAPSVQPGMPEPASEPAAPPGVTERITWLPRSATSRFPFEATTSPAGLLNVAAGPEASYQPELYPPASVLTEPEGAMARMRWLCDQHQG